MFCNPVFHEDYVNSEVDRIYGYKFKGKHGSYSTELRQKYGYLEFSKYNRDSKTLIPNDFFKDFIALSDCAVKIYLAMRLANKIEGIKEFTEKIISEYAGISERTLKRHIKFLLKTGHICKKKTNRRNGENYIYYLKPYFSSTTGYSLLENATIRVLFTGLTDGEIKLYIYLCYMIGNKQGQSCWATQEYLANKIGKKDHSAISKMTNSMHDKHYIKKITCEKDNVLHCTYTLNY
jgi:predicted transcriptional regulator